MFVKECKECGYTIADPHGKIDPMKYWSNCFKCGSSHYHYRRATSSEKIKMKLHLMDVYKVNKYPLFFLKLFYL